MGDYASVSCLLIAVVSCSLDSCFAFGCCFAVEALFTRLAIAILYHELRMLYTALWFALCTLIEVMYLSQCVFSHL